MKTLATTTKIILLGLVLLSCQLTAWGYTKKDLLQRHFNEQQLQQALICDGSWVPYPDYTDRAAWDSLFADGKSKVIAKGEKHLNFNWRVVKATDYLTFERNGSRETMQKPFEENRRALNDLIMAELAEGKGRFIDQILNGTFHAMEMSSWALAAHLINQSSHRSMPDWREPVIDLTSAGYAATLAWVYHFFGNQFDEINPAITLRMKDEVNRRIFEPYFAKLPSSWWMANNWKPGRLVNNWNPWCNSNVLLAFLLMEDDCERLNQAVYLSMQSVDQFINYVSTDGACEEGPSYWGHAAGKLYDYLQILSYATNGKINIFDEPQVKNMGEYIARSYIGDGWVVNFADASGKGGADAPLIYRYGNAVNSEVMKGFAAMVLDGKKPAIHGGNDTYRSLESVMSYLPLANEAPNYKQPAFTWYPETEFCYITNKDHLFFAAKGGHNNESHNHNDIGTFILYANNKPLLIDAGVGTYTKQTFSSKRYDIWTMQTNYHNLPLINGFAQKDGAKYKAADAQANGKKGTFSVDIAGAYPAEAGIESYLRKYTLKGKALTINDSYQLKEANTPNQLVFMTAAQPVEKSGDRLDIDMDGTKATIHYPRGWQVAIEPVALDDIRLSKIWGDKIYRIVLTQPHAATKGSYDVKIVVD